MTPNIPDKVLLERPGDLTGRDRDMYAERLDPYKEQVYERKVPLTAAQINSLGSIRKELRQVYGITKDPLFGAIHGVLAQDQMLRESIDERLLEEEARQLESELDRNPALKEERKIFARLDKIFYQLDPYHYHRVRLH